MTKPDSARAIHLAHQEHLISLKMQLRDAYNQLKNCPTSDLNLRGEYAYKTIQIEKQIIRFEDKTFTAKECQQLIELDNQYAQEFASESAELLKRERQARRMDLGLDGWYRGYKQEYADWGWNRYQSANRNRVLILREDEALSMMGEENGNRLVQPEREVLPKRPEAPPVEQNGILKLGPKTNKNTVTKNVRFAEQTRKHGKQHPVDHTKISGGPPAATTEATEARWAERWELARLDLNGRRHAIISCGLVVISGLAALFFAPGSPANVLDKKSKGKPQSNPDPDSQNSFAISRDHFLDAYEMLSGSTEPSDDWAGNSSNFYFDSNSKFGDLLEKITTSSQSVDTCIKSENEQVNIGRKNLGNSFDGLFLAIPVSESLYDSGPVGPALSYSFQLAATNSAVSAATDTTNTMHDNAQNNGKNLTILTQKYDEALDLMQDSA